MVSGEVAGELKRKDDEEEALQLIDKLADRMGRMTLRRVLRWVFFIGVGAAASNVGEISRATRQALTGETQTVPVLVPGEIGIADLRRIEQVATTLSEHSRISELQVRATEKEIDALKDNDKEIRAGMDDIRSELRDLNHKADTLLGYVRGKNGTNLYGPQ